jgi:hypothetical protein
MYLNLLLANHQVITVESMGLKEFEIMLDEHRTSGKAISYPHAFYVNLVPLTNGQSKINVRLVEDLHLLPAAIIGYFPQTDVQDEIFEKVRAASSGLVLGRKKRES